MSLWIERFKQQHNILRYLHTKLRTYVLFHKIFVDSSKWSETSMILSEFRRENYENNVIENILMSSKTS